MSRYLAGVSRYPFDEAKVVADKLASEKEGSHPRFLLIGGAGETERDLGGRGRRIGIFPTGSDFNVEDDVDVCRKGFERPGAGSLNVKGNMKR